MIRLRTNQTEYFNDMGDVVRTFCALETIVPEGTEYSLDIWHFFSGKDADWVNDCVLYDAAGNEVGRYKLVKPEVKTADNIHISRLKKRYAKLAVYHLLSEYFHRQPPWGALTGIRPSKLVRQLMWQGRNQKQALDYMADVFEVREDKIHLLESILDSQEGIYRFGDDDRFDLYIHIPFCKSRCLYCSFYSAGVQDQNLVEEYMAALRKEVQIMSAHLAAQGKKLRAIYVGGGTPTAVGNDRLRQLLEEIQKNFGTALECTVEAGRPDTADQDTFRMLRDMGVGRVSINPQSMKEKTLQLIGRRHTPEDILNAYESARKAGISVINMDIIAGLPGERLEDIERTLEQLSLLSMDNFTVHTLAVKRSSRLRETLENYSMADDEEAEAMLTEAAAFALAKGMKPYYMYRQKYMRGNLENVGYALPGKQCVYNVDMMEETHHIVALGAGAISKRMYYDRGLHVRLAPQKDVKSYLASWDQNLREKRQFFTWDEPSMERE